MVERYNPISNNFVRILHKNKVKIRDYTLYVFKRYPTATTIYYYFISGKVFYIVVKTSEVDQFEKSIGPFLSKNHKKMDFDILNNYFTYMFAL